MNVQGSYNNQVGKDLHTSGPAFQQLPPPPPPPPRHHGPFAPQPQAIQQGHPSFHPTPDSFKNRHALPSFPHQGPPAPVVPSGMSSAQSYLSHTQPPHTRNQISHPYPISEQHVPWSQNVHQLPPPPTAPFPGPNAYPLPSPQGHTLERGQSNRYPSHGPLPGPPPLPPYPTSSNYLTSDPFGSSAFRQHSYLQPMGPPPPPPPPPPLHPPLPSSSPPRVPPLPPSSPPSDVPSKNGGIRSSNDVLDEDNSMLEHPIPVKSAEDRNLHQNEVPCHHTEYNGPTMESTDAVVAYSPTGSDMEMEDDITHPDEEEKDLLSAIRDGGCTSVSQEEFLKEQPQALQHIGEHKGSKNALHENLLFGEAAVLMDQRGSSEVVSRRKVSSEADESGMTKNGQTEQPLMASVNESSPQQKYSSERSVALVCEETGNEELSRQHLEGVNSFNLLQGYASDNISENEGDNLLGDASSPALGGSINSDAERECVVEPKIRVQSPSESDTPVHPESLTESPRNVLEAGKFSLANGILEELSDEGHRGRESVTTSAPLQSKDPSRSHDTCIGLESAKFEKQDMKSNFPEMEVDEFGRLVREGGSDSDTSDSPRSTRRHARRSRKRSNSRSRSQSPHERRRSPRRNKRSRDRSRSLSPNRRRIRSRSPFLRRDTEFSGDKRRGEKSQLQECFDFRRGKCYRGSTCRYLHHESNNSEILRCNRGKQQSTLWSSVHEEGKVHCDKEVNDKELPQDIPSLREEVRVAKELPVDWNSHSPDKLSSLVSGSLPFADVVKSNRSGYSAYHMPSGKENPLILESPARCSDKMPQIVHQQGKMMGDYLVSESSSLVQVSSGHLTAEQPGTEEGPTSQLLSVVSPITEPYSTEEVQSESLKEAPTSVASQSTITLPPVSQVMTASFGQDYKTIPPIAGFHSTPENRSPYQAPAAYQRHSRFPGPSNSLSSPYLPPPPPLPPPHHLSVNIALGEHGNPSQHTQQPLQHPRDGLLSYTSIRAHPTEMPNHSQTYQYQAYQLPREPDHMLHTNENLASSSLHVSNLSSLNSGPRITGPPVQGMHPSQSFSQAQNYSLRANSPSKATHSSFGGGLPSDINSSHGQPYFQHSSYGLQYSSGGIPVQFARSEKVSSSVSSLTPDLLEKNQPSYVHNFIGSRISNHFNPYASTFDKPLNSKFKFNSSIGISDTITVPDASVVSKNIISSSSSGLPALSVLPRPGGDQYDPLFDSIDPPSTLFNRAAQEKHETPGDSDNMPRFTGSGRVLDMEIIKQDEAIALSANDSMENEEFGETAEGEVNDVSNGSPCTPNDATDVNGEETESDQMKASRKKRKGKDSRSMKLFKISVAGFVKDVLKPSWRQGNMSKEAFKTIVKKTVDKVSGAMKGHRVPKSQSKINQYIDSSRGKLTKLVMGYVDKYVKS